MIEVRKYGLVYVSIGLAITGSLWYMRENPTIRGEDVAELASAVVERQTIAYLTGTNSPSFASNNIPVWITLSGLMDKILTPSRDMATREDYAPPSIYWLNDDISDGDAITGYKAQWYVASTNAETGSGAYSSTVHTVTSYRLTGPSNNVTDYAWTTASRTPGNWTFLSNTTRTNAPLGRSIYGVTNGWVEGTAKSWWGEIGNGTNVYAYWSERFVDSGLVTVNLLHGGGQVVTSEEIHFTTNNYATPQTVSIKNTTTNTAAYFEFDVENYGSTFVCVGSYPNTNPRVKKDGEGLGAYVAMGGSIDFVMTSESAITVPWTVSITYGGNLTGPSSIASTNEPYYSADFTVGCPANGGGTFSTYCPQTGAAQTVAVIGDTHNTNITVNTYAVNVDNGGTADFSVSLATNPPAPYFAQSRSISTNYLNNAKNVLANLNRTIYICAPDELSFTSGVQVTISSDGGWSSSNANVSVETLWALASSEAVAGDPETVVSWNVRLIEYSRSAWRDAQKTGDAAWSYGADYGMVLAATRLNGCTLPYPSDYALASQYVASVSVYVATMNHVANALYGYGSMGTYTTGYEITGSYSDLNNMLAAGFGIGVDPSTANLPSIPVTEPTTTESAFYSTIDDTVPPLMSFRLLATSANPTERVKFTLGTTIPTIPNYAFRYDTYRTDTYTDPDYTVIYDDDKMEAGINVDAVFFLVVVDWKWQHMNLSVPYEPTAFTPDWLTGNTNSP